LCLFKKKKKVKTETTEKMCSCYVDRCKTQPLSLFPMLTHNVGFTLDVQIQYFFNEQVPLDEIAVQILKVCFKISQCSIFIQ